MGNRSSTCFNGVTGKQGDIGGNFNALVIASSCTDKDPHELESRVESGRHVEAVCSHAPVDVEFPIQLTVPVMQGAAAAPKSDGRSNACLFTAVKVAMPEVPYDLPGDDVVASENSMPERVPGVEEEECLFPEELDIHPIGKVMARVASRVMSDSSSAIRETSGSGADSQPEPPAHLDVASCVTEVEKIVDLDTMDVPNSARGARTDFALSDIMVEECSLAPQSADVFGVTSNARLGATESVNPRNVIDARLADDDSSDPALDLGNLGFTGCKLATEVADASDCHANFNAPAEADLSVPNILSTPSCNPTAQGSVTSGSTTDDDATWDPASFSAPAEVDAPACSWAKLSSDGSKLPAEVPAVLGSTVVTGASPSASSRTPAPAEDHLVECAGKSSSTPDCETSAAASSTRPGCTAESCRDDTAVHKDGPVEDLPPATLSKEVLEERQVKAVEPPIGQREDVGEANSSWSSPVKSLPLAARPSNLMPVADVARAGQQAEVEHHQNMLPVTVPVMRSKSVDTRESSSSCFCGFDQCFMVDVDQHELPKTVRQETTMVSHGDRLDAVWRVVGRTYIRKEMAADSARIFPLDVSDEITVTAIVNAELRTIAPAVGWVSLVSAMGEPLVMMGGSEETSPQSYPAADLGEAFLSTIARDDHQHAVVLARDLIESEGLEAVHVATIRRVIAEGRSSWGKVCEILDASVGNWDPPQNDSGVDFSALKAAILFGDAGRANELLRRPRARVDLHGTLLGPYTAMVEELLAVSARRAAKAKSRSSCICGMNTCAKCSSLVWERLLQFASEIQDDDVIDRKIQALSALERSTFVVTIETDVNTSGTYEYIGEESFRPVYRLGKSQTQLQNIPRRLLRWHPGKGYDGEWRLCGGDGLTPLYCATERGCSAADTFLPPEGNWQPIGHHREGRVAVVRLEVRAAELPAVLEPALSKPARREPANAELDSKAVALAGPPTSLQKVGAPVLSSGIVAAATPSVSSQLLSDDDADADDNHHAPRDKLRVSPPTWQASFAEDAKAASKCVAGPPHSPAAQKPVRRGDAAADSRRYAQLPKLTGENSWQLVSLCRLNTLQVHRLRPVPDLFPSIDEDEENDQLLSGVGEEGHETEEKLLMTDGEGQAFIKPRSLGKVLESLGHSPTEVELWKRTSEVLSFTDFLAIISCKLDVKGNTSLEKEAMQTSFKALKQKGDGHLTPDELRRSMLRLQPILERFGLEELSVELTDAEVEAMISYADVDRDGLVSIEEFSRVMHAVATAEFL